MIYVSKIADVVTIVLLLVDSGCCEDVCP